MITSQELQFVRMAMRQRLLTANVVQEAVERKKWDAPDQPISQILVDMGALQPETAQKLRKQLDVPVDGQTKLRSTQVGKDPSAHDPELEGVPGRIGPYQIVRMLGAGAMGAVYAARHVELQRDVALKLLQSEGAPSPRAVARFKREARLAARLDHPNIVRVWEAGQDGQQHYIAMDLVRGKSVGELLTLGELTVRRAVHIMRKTAEATAYAHEQGVIHRDLKPANILVDDKTGEPRVTDFGLATLAEPDEDDKLTRTGAAVGTPAYMAPEQVRGRLHEIDRRTDVYALGATLYEMLTGSAPFDAPTFLELAKKICDEDPAPPRRKNPAVPVAVETVVLKALEKEPSARYQTASDMAADLAAFLDDAPIRARPPTPLERARRWAKRRPAVVAGAAGFVAVLGAGLGFWLSLPGRLELATAPEGAVVLVDGQEILDEQGQPATTPVALKVPAGEHELRFRLEGYLEQALGVDAVRVGHGETLHLSATLASTSGLLRVTTRPPMPGAPVSVLAPDGSSRAQGETPFFTKLEAGEYRVVIGAPGGWIVKDGAEQQVTVRSGGQEKAVEATIARDGAELTIDADPENVTVRWAKDDTSRVAPTTLPGSGAHEVELSRAGYLPQRLTITVPPGGKVERRVTLVPLAAWRRPLEGRLLAPPLVRDVDADGAPDLLVLEEAPDGARFALLPGGGHVRAAFRVSTTARALLDTDDVDGDGVLDVLLGGEQHLELRDGRSGRVVARLPGVDGLSAVVHRAEPSALPQVLLLEAGDAPRLVPMSLAGVVPGVPAPGPRARPALVPRGVRLGSFSPRSLAVFPMAGGILVWSVDGSEAPSRLPLAGVTPTSAVLPIVVDRQGDPWVAVVPDEGPAWIVDPQTKKRHAVGDPTARFRRPAFLAHDQAWLLLTDEAKARTRTFALDPGKSIEKEALSPGAVVLRTGEKGEKGEKGGQGPAVWTSAGDVYTPAADTWKRLDACSTDPEVWASRDAEPTVADADGDGLPEILLPAPDRRAVVALDPTPGRVRWRVRQTLPDAVTTGEVDVAPGDDLVLGVGDALVGRSGEDGRQVLAQDAKGRVLAVAAGRPAKGEEASVLYTVSTGVEGRDDAAARTVTRWVLHPHGAWGSVWDQTRPALGVEALTLDVDGDGAHDLLTGGPLAVLKAKDGTEAWTERFGGQPAALGSAGPRLLRGAVPLCVGTRDPSREGGVPSLVAHDPLGKLVWETPLAFRRPGPDGGEEVEVPDPPRLVVGEETDPTLVVITARRVLALLRTDGALRWAFEPPADAGTVVGAAVAGGVPARVVLTYTSGLVVALDAANKDSLLWARRLPAAERATAPSVPVLLPAPRAPSRPEGSSDPLAPEAAVAVVAPSGVLLLLALDDGALLAERRSSTGAFLPWLVALPPTPGQAGQTGHSLVLASDDGRLVALPAAPQRRAKPGRRQQILDEVRRLELGTPHARAALASLQVLVSQNPTDPVGQLGLARAHLALGDHVAALNAAKLATAPGRRNPEALRVQAEATYALRRSMQEVDPFLDELAAADPARAAEVALDLAGRTGIDASRFLRKVRDLAPLDASVRRHLGFERLRSISTPTRVWNAAPLDDLADVRRAAAEARAELLVSLTRENDAEARAGAIVALLLERRITVVAAARRNARPDAERLALLGTILPGLVTPAGGDEPEVLRLARQLAGLKDDGDIDAFAPVIAALAEKKKDWAGALQGIGSLRP